MLGASLPEPQSEFELGTLPDPFLDAIRCPSGAIDVLGAALALTLDARPGANTQGIRRQLDEWGERLSRRIRHAGLADNPLSGTLLLNRMLYEEEGFAGDVVAPRDPANSEVDLVMERRRGLPIMLALLHVEIGKRAGLPLHGVAFPGRFLVGLATPPRATLFDPYQRAHLLLPEDLSRLLEALTGRSEEVRPEYVEACPRRRFVERMLNNLKQAYLQDGNLAAAVRVQGRVVDLRPGEAGPLQERAWLQFQAGWHRDALADLQRASGFIRDERAADELERQLEHVKRWIAAAR